MSWLDMTVSEAVRKVVRRIRSTALVHPLLRVEDRTASPYEPYVTTYPGIETYCSACAEAKKSKALGNPTARPEPSSEGAGSSGDGGGRSERYDALLDVFNPDGFPLVNARTKQPFTFEMRNGVGELLFKRTMEPYNIAPNDTLEMTFTVRFTDD